MQQINKKILIVEDDKDFSWILRQSLESQFLTVVYAMDGEEGLAMAQKENPDLIVIDILMPKMDGITMARKIKEKGIKSRMDNIIKDEFGPELIVKVYDKKIGLEGFLVVDNTKLGLGKGGLRMTPSVTVEEVARLARTMTWKNALAGIPFGGAKSGIVWNGGS